jgi:isoquinoline 1-oxidoreductase alpha subunit
MARITLKVNSNEYDIDVEPSTPLLWVLREYLGLTGTKYGCGIAMCGSCTIHMDGAAVRSCILPVTAAEGREITTIEGLSEDRSHPLQQAWIEEQVPQCGYCQSGQIMQAAALLYRYPDPTDEQIKTEMNGVLCRCGTYMRIRRAIKSAANQMR